MTSQPKTLSASWPQPVRAQTVAIIDVGAPRSYYPRRRQLLWCWLRGHRLAEAYARSLGGGLLVLLSPHWHCSDCEDVRLAHQRGTGA